MKIKLFNCSIFLFCLLASQHTAAAADRGRQLDEKRKQISKTYQVNAGDRVEISNSYGFVKVNTWNRNEVKIDVEVIANESSAQKAQELLDKVNIEQDQGNGRISWRTRFDQSGFRWSGKKGNDKRGLEVNYTIHMPATNPLSCSNNYGDIILPDFSGDVKISVNYGEISSGRLSGSSNQVNLNYGELNLPKGYGQLDINANYSDIEIGSGNKLDLKLNYGDADIGETGDLELKVNYSDLSIAGIGTRGSISATYCGDMRIAKLGSSLQELNLSASYTNMVLSKNNNSSYRFDARFSYGNLSYGSNTQITQPPDPKSRTSKTYQGIYGTGSPTGELSIRFTYGNVTFK